MAASEFKIFFQPSGSSIYSVFLAADILSNLTESTPAVPANNTQCETKPPYQHVDYVSKGSMLLVDQAEVGPLCKGGAANDSVVFKCKTKCVRYFQIKVNLYDLINS